MAFIDKEKLIKSLELSIKSWSADFNSNAPVIARTYRDVLSRVKNIPVADVAEVKHGKWDINKNCSVCGVYKFEGLDADVWADWDIDYCPHCGAKMDGKDGE